MFFKKYHIIKIQHLLYKDIFSSFKFQDNLLLKNFLKEHYSIKNYKISLIIDPSLINIAEMVEVYNLNPYLESLLLEDIVSPNSKQFLKKFNINNYDIEYEVHKDEADSESAYYIYMKNDKNDFDMYLFPNFETFYINLKRIKESNIEHNYLVEPSIIDVNDYLKTLSLYGEFKNRNFKNSFEINQYIKDIIVLSEIKQPEKVITELT